MNLEMAMEGMKLRISWYILMANHFKDVEIKDVEICLSNCETSVYNLDNLG